MFNQLGLFVVKRKRIILLAYILFVALTAGFGSGVLNDLKTQGYDDPNSASTRVESLLKNEFKVPEVSTLVIVDTPLGVDNPDALEFVSTLTSSIKEQSGVANVVSYWSLGKPETMRSTDNKAAFINVYFDSNLSDEEANKLGGTLQDIHTGTKDGFSVYVGGLRPVYYAINDRIKRDLTKAESIAIPLNIIMLIFIFGAAIAGGLPMIVALGSISGSLLILNTITQFADVSVFALNLVTGLGLGLGIDYALLVVNRFREELNKGSSVDQAVVNTVSSAGRTVWFSGLAVMLVLACMYLFPQYFLKSFAYAGVSVVACAILATLTALPATLAILGKRIEKFTVRKSATGTHDDGIWAWLSVRVMRFPWPVIAVTTLLLSALAFPALSAKFGQIDERVLPSTDRTAIAGEVIRNRFDAQIASPIQIIIPKSQADQAEVDEVARRVAAMPGIANAATQSRIFSGNISVPNTDVLNNYESSESFLVTAVSEFGARQSDGVNQLNEIRELPLPAGTLVGGASAVYVDSQAGIADNLALVAGLLALATFIVLFLYTGSVLLPIKAIILNLASLSATLGLLTWIFQDGNLQWLTGDFTVTGVLDTSTIVLIAIVAFGLSMDYEVFMLSRIKEEHDRGANTFDAVSFGLQRSGRIITAAALLIAIVFATFVTSGVTSIKMLGIGIAFAIMLDATIVRGLLVPALMRVAGRWNWWAPPILRRLHSRIGIVD